MKAIFNFDAWQEVTVRSLTEVATTIAGFLPKLLGMIVILMVGWLLARLLQLAAQRGLSRVGLDRTTERIGITETLRQAGIEGTPSQLLARLLFWLLMLTFILSAVETLGLTAVTATIDRLIAYVPNIIAAALIVVIGLVLARFAGNVVGSGAAAANLLYARQLGSVARSTAIAMVAILAVEQLGVDTQLLLWAVVVILGSSTLGLAFAFAIGSRDVVRAMMAGHYLRQSLVPGGSVRVEGRRGALVRIGPVDTLFRGGDLEWSIPNARLLELTLERSSDDESSPGTAHPA